jgi:hypothetical protein
MAALQSGSIEFVLSVSAALATEIANAKAPQTMAVRMVLPLQKYGQCKPKLGSAAARYRRAIPLSPRHLEHLTKRLNR